MKKYLKSPSEFTSNFLILTSGTTISQLFPLLVSPILSRLYSPEEFGVLALFTSLITVLAIFSTMRYDQSIMLPEDNEEAYKLLYLNLLLSIIVLLISSLIIFFVARLLSNTLNNEKIYPWLFLLPLSTFFMSTYRIFRIWFNRQKNYKIMSSGSIILSSSNNLIGIILGFLVKTFNGMMVGRIISQFLSTLYMLVKYSKNKYKFSKKINFIEIVELLKKYKSFPLFSFPAGLINIVTNQLPIFIIDYYFGTKVLGLFSLTQRVLGQPVILFSNSILEVFKERATSDYNKYGNCLKIFKKTLLYLVLLGSPLFLIIFLFSKQLFVIFFGPEWSVTGEYSQILSVFFFLRFIASPLSYTIYITQKQYIDFIWQAVLISLIIVSFLIGIHFNDIKICLILFSSSYSFMYLIYLFISYKLAKGNIR
ncbi:MAG: oligosaccharide flippase family protein [Candidatus Cloacimonetes bacterium]|nr:oligosaccharide flippase family protein [Candidatus Cloacimonadota bacterium]